MFNVLYTLKHAMIKSMSRIIFLLCCLLLNRASVLGQKQLSGKVLSVEGIPLKDVHIIVSLIEKSKPIAFAFSDNKGQFVVNLPSLELDSVSIKFSTIGYATQTLLFSVQSGLQLPEVRLLVSAKNLPEVVVKSNPVIQRRDTISYDVKAFSEKQDMVLADVLRRMPGIEVTDNGTVKYQGRAINRYYIEGLNLLDAKYGLANNNIPVGAVEQVQVLENHQPLKVLDSVTISNRAALNIKLTGAAKNTLIGRAKTGIGIPALLADAELVPMRFAKTEQVLLSYKFNNAGFNYTNELLSLTDDITTTAKTPLLSIPAASLPTFSQQRYLFNKQHVLSVNYLKKIRQGKELKVNIDFVQDYQKQQTNTYTVNYFGTDTVRIRENQTLRLRETQVNGQVEILSNNEKQYTVNGIRFGYSSGNDNGEIGFPKLSEQKLLDHFVWFEKYGKSIRKVKKWIHGFNYHVGYNKSPQQLNIAPDISGYFFSVNLNIDSLMQKAALEKWYAKAGYTVALSIGRFSFEQAASVGYHGNKYHTALYKFEKGESAVVADSISNRFEAQEWSALYVPRLNYKEGKWKLSAQVPVNFLMHHNNNQQRNQLNRLFVTYDISGQYTFNSNLNVLVNWVYDQFYLPAYLASDRYTMVNYRSLVNQNGIIKRRNRESVTGYLFYKNTIRSLFGNLFIASENSLDNYITDQRFNGSFLMGNTLERENPARVYKGGGALSKYLSKLKTTLSVSANLQQSKGQQSNAGFISYYQVHITGLTAKLNTRIRDMVFDYAVQLSHIKSRVGDKKSWNNTRNQSQLLSISYALPRQYLLKWGVEVNNFSTDGGAARQFLFSDFLIRKNMGTSKMSVDLYWQNMFNLKQMETIMVNGNQIMTQTYQLRPSQCMLRLHFNL